MALQNKTRVFWEKPDFKPGFKKLWFLNCWKTQKVDNIIIFSRIYLAVKIQKSNDFSNFC